MSKNTDAIKFIGYPPAPRSKSVPIGWRERHELRWERKNSTSYIRRALSQNLWFAYIDGKIIVSNGGLPEMWTNPLDATGYVETHGVSIAPFKGKSKK